MTITVELNDFVICLVSTTEIDILLAVLIALNFYYYNSFFVYFRDSLDVEENFLDSNSVFRIKTFLSQEQEKTKTEANNYDD